MRCASGRADARLSGVGGEREGAEAAAAARLAMNVPPTHSGLGGGMGSPHLLLRFVLQGPVHRWAMRLERG